MKSEARLLIILFFVGAISICFSARAVNTTIDYGEPENLTGTVYADGTLTRVLFTFRRTATRSGSTVQVYRDFYLPDGTLAARERVIYQGGQLKSFSLDDFQIGSRGSAVVQPSAREAKMNFQYAVGTTRRNGNEKFMDQILVNDMVGQYISSHWEALARGQVLKCRVVSIPRAETVGFKFFKESETTWHGKPVMIVKAQPTSFLIAQLVAPLHFIVDKTGAHNVLEYTGRTTPKFRKNGKWEDLDAVTVIDWNGTSRAGN
ncbi:MAG TPA: hypothetical protein VKV04_20650 [Verrucomicrobiae bacterium]|nr:hypothetical protein [Verrucomicrobiae bacterium]